SYDLAEHDDELLPPRLAIEDTVSVPRSDLLAHRAPGGLDHALKQAGGGGTEVVFILHRPRRQHADHAVVATEGKPFDAVFGFAPSPRHDGGAETHHPLCYADVEQLRRNEVPHLVQGD